MNKIVWLSIKLIVLIIVELQISIDCQFFNNKKHGVIFIQEINSWSKCSETCGLGFQTKLTACFKNTFYMSEQIPLERCRHLKKINSTTRPCNYGECNHGYYWKVGGWSQCSQTCGNTGIQMREVDCFQTDGWEVDKEYCHEYPQPRSLQSCNAFHCPPQFLATKWGTCSVTDDCSPGQQKRDLNCVTLLSNGTVARLKKQACYMKAMIPPSRWRKCYNYKNSSDCAKKLKLVPEIYSENRVVVQMLKFKRLELKAGQIAFIIPDTRTSLNCPVKNFLPINLVWNHNEKYFRYDGKSDQPLYVNRKGFMIINSFALENQGKWTCRAGNVSSQVVIISKSPSDGFKDWVVRNSNWNKEMQGNEIEINVIRWVVGDWSKCSVSCENIGIQSRMVNCENVESRLYYRLEDAECLKKFGHKPLTEKRCERQFPCPKWTFKDQNKIECTNQCVDIEKAALNLELRCVFQSQSIEYSKCDPKEKPALDCYNSNCRVKWKISSWTECSQSCGSQGVQARYLMCVWNHTEINAGDLCYKVNLPIPSVIRSCTPPKCNLKCIDLFKNCRRTKYYCLVGIYNYWCCKTCRDFFPTLSPKKLNYINI